MLSSSMNFPADLTFSLRPLADSFLCLSLLLNQSVGILGWERLTSLSLDSLVGMSVQPRLLGLSRDGE